jgi:Zn-dependent protease
LEKRLQASSLDIVVAVYEFVILLFSLSFHECAHAWMASRLGDQTARLQGRVSLNPIRHIDPLGTLVFPALMIFGPLIGFGGAGMMIGWAKPTPVITRNFKHITRDDNLTTLAGPASNLILVVIGMVLLIGIIFGFSDGREAVIGAIQSQIGSGSAAQALALLGWLTIEVNLALMIFNLVPIPPLDGSHVLRNMLPYSALNAFDQIGRFGFILILILGRFVVGFFLGPAMRLVLAFLIPFLQVHRVH